MSEAINYYNALKGEWKIGLRGEFPVLNKIDEDHYELGRGNDLCINVDLFIQGYDESETAQLNADGASEVSEEVVE